LKNHSGMNWDRVGLALDPTFDVFRLNLECHHREFYQSVEKLQAPNRYGNEAYKCQAFPFKPSRKESTKVSTTFFWEKWDKFFNP
jgi:hypothetical protein